MNLRILLISSLFILAIFPVKAQDKPATPTLIGTGVFTGETRALRDIPAQSAEEYLAMKNKADLKLLNKKLRERFYPNSENALPKGSDEVWQKVMGDFGKTKAPIANFTGQSSPYYPPDCNGAVGPNHYMQTINTVYTIYNKSGALVAGPTNMNVLFGGVTGTNYNDGDPLVLYDEQAGRWLAVEFSISGANDYMLIAVSTTNDPTGTWYTYSFDVADTPDYEKFGIWQDGYYMGDNNSASNDIYVFQRSVMLSGGGSPGMVAFNNPNRPSSIDGFMCVPPVDNDGAFAPAGAPGIFIAFNDDAIGGGSDQLWIYELAVNWTTPASSTFGRVQQLAVAAFDSNFGNDWTNIAQPGTTQQLDAIPQVVMNIPQYRNFGSYQTIVCCHSVDVDATDHAGVRWYELRRGTESSGNWAVRQQGTYAPDAHSRWMGSISLNGGGKIGLGYSISSSTVYPGIRYTGQSASAYAAGNGIMDIPEAVIHEGAYSQTGVERWGDYSAISIDPTDDQTFWFTSQYIGTGGARQTKIASFKFGNFPGATTLPATLVTAASATLNGSVNPTGLETTYHFQWGTDVTYGNNTATVSAGSGSTEAFVNANLTSLTGGTTYHFRLVATNSEGTANGADLSFVAGAAEVATAAVTAITQTTATSGGSVTTDGGSAVSARGVCWSTALNPTISDSHTTDGAGLGAFPSSITNLLPGTTYHVRAYATNPYGTYYGSDLTFSTLCGNVTTFPYVQTFDGLTFPPTCWTKFIGTNGIGTANNWLRTLSSTYNSSAGAAYVQYEVVGTGLLAQDWLVTPQISIPATGTTSLSFYQRQGYASDYQTSYSIRVSPGSQTNISTFTSISTYGESTFSTTYSLKTIDLSSYAGQQIYIAFVMEQNDGDNWYVEDVTITHTGGVAPVANFSADVTTTCPGNTVSFTDLSTNTPTSWAWMYSPATVTFTGGTSAASQNPKVSFDQAGNYSVTLTATNANGSDPEVKTDYITVNPVVASAGAIKGAATFTPGATGVAYSVVTITNATSYIWTYTGTGVTINGTGNSITLDFTASATSGQLKVKGHNTCGDGAESSISLSPDFRTLNLTAVMLQGLYNSTTHTMNQAQGASGPNWGDGSADHITVELHDVTNYATIIYAISDIPLSTTGTASVTIPGTYSNAYYITIKHRNSIETTTSAAISFAGTIVAQSFGAIANVYQGNMVQMSDGTYAIYCGNPNQDGLVDLSDLISVGNSAAIAGSGYLPEDVNGDGLVDLSDLILVGNSAALAIGAILP